MKGDWRYNCFGVIMMVRRCRRKPRAHESATAEAIFLLTGKWKGIWNSMS